MLKGELDEKISSTYYICTLNIRLKPTVQLLGFALKQHYVEMSKTQDTVPSKKLLIKGKILTQCCFNLESFEEQ